MEKVLQKIRKSLPLLAFIAAAAWLFYQLYPIVFATHDDLSPVLHYVPKFAQTHVH